MPRRPRLNASSVRVDRDNPTRVVLATKSMGTDGVVVDSLRIQDGLVSINSGKRVEIPLCQDRCRL